MEKSNRLFETKFKRSTSKIMLIIGVALLFSFAVFVNAQEEEFVFIGSEVVDNKVSVSNKNLDMTFDYLIDHAKGGWYVFDGQIKANTDFNNWDLIVTSNTDMNIQLGSWGTVKREVPKTVCTDNSFTYPNDTVDLNKTCNVFIENIDESGWDYSNSNVDRQVDGLYRYVFQGINLADGDSMNLSLRVERTSVPSNSLTEFDVLLVPAERTKEEAESLQIGGGVDPIVDSSINEIARWELSSNGQDSEGDTHLSGGPTFTSDTIGTTAVNVANFDGSSQYFTNTSINEYLKLPNGGSMAVWWKKNADQEFQLGGIRHYTNGYHFGYAKDSVASYLAIQINGNAGALWGDGPTPTGQWRFETFILNDTGALEYWTNTEINKSDGTDTTLPSTSNSNFDLGHLTSGAGPDHFYFSGRMYCARIFNATLTESQINLLYNNGEPICDSLVDLESVADITSVNVSVFNGTHNNASTALESENVFSIVNFSDVGLDQEGNSTFKWHINDTADGVSTTDLVPMIYKDALLYMHLDETGNGVHYQDNSGNGHEGEPHDGTDNVSGRINGGVDFDGTADAILIDDANALDPVDEITITAWVKPEPKSSKFQVVYKRGAYEISTDGSTKWRFSITSGAVRQVLSNSLIQNKAWTHTTGVFNGTHVAIYINGELDNTAAFSGTIDESARKVAIGSHVTTGDVPDTNYFNGTIDEVGIYNRSFNASEIKQIYLRTMYDHSPQLFLLQPFFKNETWLKTSDDEAPIGYSNSLTTADNISGVWNEVKAVNLTDGYLNYSADGNFNEKEGTIEFWVKPDWNGNDNQHRAFFAAEKSDNDFFLYKRNSNDLRLRHEQISDWILSYDVSDWTKGAWHHVGLTWSNYTSNTTLHVDGVQVNNSNTPSAYKVQESFLIGAEVSGSPTNYCDCAIAEFRISGKVLTSQEIGLSFSKSKHYFQNEYLLNSSNYQEGDVLRLEYSPKDSTGTSGNITNSSSVTVHTFNTASEAESDIAIEVGINSSISSAIKYNEQQVYVRNSSNSHTLGVFDWVASFGNKRWLINYISSGESYVSAPNLSSVVYVLEIEGKITQEITDEVSRLINATKS
jgi:hypothetical protein